LHHALGLALVRAKRLDEAIAELRQAAELDPDQARYVYVYAVALNSAGRRDDAIDTLKESLTRHPNDRDNADGANQLLSRCREARIRAPVR
jgi:Flp pilus assembly protein TadD